MILGTWYCSYNHNWRIRQCELDLSGGGGSAQWWLALVFSTRPSCGPLWTLSDRTGSLWRRQLYRSDHLCEAEWRQLDPVTPAAAEAGLPLELGLACRDPAHGGRVQQEVHGASGCHHWGLRHELPSQRWYYVSYNIGNVVMCVWRESAGSEIWTMD